MKEFEQLLDIESTYEIWVKKAPHKGDHIRVKRVWGIYAHHGIYVSDDEVIHFTGRDGDSILVGEKPEVIVTDLDYFLRGGELEVKEYTEDERDHLYPADDIVNYARACIGDKGYNLVLNNCEHFANECTLGIHRSKQVDRFIIGAKEDKKMGLLGNLWNGLKGAIAGFAGGFKGVSSSSSSNSQPRGRYVYEPDKVKISEIEADTQLRLANKEKERIEYMKQARIDILQFETQSQLDIERAKAEGNILLMNALVEMQEKLNVIAQNRLEMILSGSTSMIKEIDDYYTEIINDIGEKNYEYTEQKLPVLFEHLDRYEPGSAAYRLYEKRISDDMESQKKYYEKQLEKAEERRIMVLKGFMESRDQLMLQTGEFITEIIETSKEYAKGIATKAVKSLPLEQNK